MRFLEEFSNFIFNYHTGQNYKFDNNRVKGMSYNESLSTNIILTFESISTSLYTWKFKGTFSLIKVNTIIIKENNF